MFGLGTSELLIILVIVMLVFGASRLPQLGKGLGEGMRSFKDAIKGNPEADKESTPVKKDTTT
jgi:sec-independent protein translocase protein TatA